MEKLFQLLENPFGMTAFFFLGVFTSLHCICMCGPLSIIIFGSNQTPSKNRLIAYHGSRVLSYTWIGLLTGSIGLQFANFGLSKLWILTIVFFLCLFAFGKTRWLTKPLFKFQSFVLHRARHLSTVSKSMLMGFFSPLLPCGPLYGAILASSLAPTVFESGLWMFCFSLGTIPLLALQQWGLLKLNQSFLGAKTMYYMRYLAFLIVLFLLWMHFI